MTGERFKDYSSCAFANLYDFIQNEISIDDIISKNIKTPSDKVLAANGQYFRKDKKGFLNEMMQSMYEDRVIYKKKMIEAQKELEKVNKLLNE